MLGIVWVGMSVVVWVFVLGGYKDFSRAGLRVKWKDFLLAGRKEYKKVELMEFDKDIS